MNISGPGIPLPIPGNRPGPGLAEEKEGDRPLPQLPVFSLLSGGILQPPPGPGNRAFSSAEWRFLRGLSTGFL